MSDLFSWVGDLIEWAARFIPRLVIVRSTHLGIKYVRGKKLVSVEPGICFYWPLITEMDLIGAVRQTLSLPPQRLASNDGKRLLCRGVVVFTIADVKQAAGLSIDFDDVVRDMSMGAIASVVTGSNYEDLQNSDALRVRLTEQVRADLRKYGVRVQRCMLIDFCPANVIALSTDEGYSSVLEEDE